MEIPELRLLTDDDGVALVRLLNEAMTAARRASGINDLYLHYRDGDGWRVRFNSNPEGAKEWISTTGPWGPLLAALDAEVGPIREQFARNDVNLRRRISKSANGG
ncbi:MAG TPA: hypothetical protein VNJ02_00240 [Vicinamibacterales bacterium]|nr:hypothetical protein [Vicinamibacterales bacterium]